MLAVATMYVKGVSTRKAEAVMAEFAIEGLSSSQVSRAAKLLDKAVLTGATWQRCQFHLAQNAIHHAPNQAIRKRIGAELRLIWNAPDLTSAEENLRQLVESYRDTAPGPATWLENNIPDGMAVFTLPEHHRRRLRTSNPIERAIQQEIKRRTQNVRVFPNEKSLERLVSAVLVETDDK